MSADGPAKHDGEESSPAVADEAPEPLQDLAGIDRLIHEPARLQILAQLYVVEEADFLFVMRRTGLTQGNLSSHMTRLEQAGYVEVDKGFVGKRPRTILRLTATGRRAFDEYLASMRGALEWLDGR